LHCCHTGSVALLPFGVALGDERVPVAGYRFGKGATEEESSADLPPRLQAERRTASCTACYHALH